VTSMLVAIAKFSETMLWVVGALLVADFAAMMAVFFRSGTVDKEEGCVVSGRGPLTEHTLNPRAGDVDFAVGGKYVGKEKILVSRSSFISDESLVDGSATKSQRLVVRGIKILFLLFWLLFVFGGFSLLPEEPALALFLVLIPSVFFYRARAMMRKGRQDALRKLGKNVTATR
jgi:hypothetical protein